MSNVKLGDVIKRAQTKVDKDNTNLTYYVGGEHIESENVLVQHRGVIAGSTIGPMFYYGFKSGDFLLVSRNPHLKKAGLVNFDGICSEKTFVLETSDPSVLLPQFLPFVIQNDSFWEYAYQNRHGSTNTFVNWSTIADYEFELPDLKTQKRLEDVLWGINDTIEAYKELISVTDELVKAQFIYIFGDPVENPKKWPKKKIGDLFKIVSRGKHPSYVEHSKIKVINQACIFDDELKMENVKYQEEDCKKKKYLSSGDILINSTGTGTLGRCNIFPVIDDGYNYVADGHVTVLQESDEIDAVFFKIFFLLDQTQKNIYTDCVNGSTNQIELSKDRLSDFALIVPPIELQKEFSNFVRQKMKARKIIGQSLNEARALQKKIIEENFTSKEEK